MFHEKSVFRNSAHKICSGQEIVRDSMRFPVPFSDTRLSRSRAEYKDNQLVELRGI